MSELLLGIDAGNTVVKAVLFDRGGHVQSKASRDGRSSQPEPGQVERDIAELWRNTAEVVAQCLAQAKARGGDIGAIGISGHGNGLYLLDRENRPLLGIQSLDTRAADLARELAANAAARQIYARSLQKPWPAQTATLLAWVKRNRPDLYRSIGTAFLCKDVLAFMLTGQRVTDFSDMSGCGLMRLPERRYDADLLAAYGLDDAMAFLPPPVASDQIAGRISAEAAEVTGLAAGTPVAAGFFDIIASALGAGAAMPGQAAIVAGSWGINQIILEQPLIDERIFHAATWRPDRYVAVESSATSAVNLEWFAREIMGGHDGPIFARCNELVASVALQPDLPFFHPFLYGSATTADARGAFLGLAGWHGKAHMLHALYEGVVFEHRRHIDRLRAAGGSFDQATLSGGGSCSEVWCQMFADGIGVPVTVAECEETGALGAAIAAGVAGGEFESLEAGVAAMVRAKKSYAPRSVDRRLGLARYKLYLDLAEMLPRHWAAYRAEVM
ncbi:FGGY-family carbohydrate kinase [Taklimakanibacter deserti]|uniref:FGGY-family carbohydrate kinase n=1 Tax=Taklimakanibacter deserti TaxID=2267839 RepID=UPI000E646CC8